ncbi:MAG TPA: hypothetical protein PJ989_10325 [Oligoflexia bacterium]|nr:hypothetical protein [Oligoflexia bacterium]
MGLRGGAGGGGGGTSLPGRAAVSVPIPARGSVVIREFEGTRDSEGALRVSIDITGSAAGGALSMQVATFASEPEDFFTRRFETQNGVVLLDSGDVPLRSLAMVFSSDASKWVNALTYPSRGRDRSLSSGSYFQTIQLPKVVRPLVTKGRVVLKNDSNLRAGVLKVNMFLLGGPAVQVSSQIDEALEIWSEIYGRVGITLDVNIVRQGSASGTLPSPLSGSVFYEEAAQSQSGRDDALNVYIGSRIEGVDIAIGTLLGISGGIPGSYFPSRRSAVAIDLEAHQGLGGVLSPSNLRTFAETIAHEAGHYLGLFHPVEINRTGGAISFEGEDPLGDTPLCRNPNECIAIGLARNLMFPTVIDPTSPQQDITPEQADVLNLQPLVK